MSSRRCFGSRLLTRQLDRLETILRDEVAQALVGVGPPLALVASQMLGLALTRFVLRLPIVTSVSRTNAGRGGRAQDPGLYRREEPRLAADLATGTCGRR